MVFSGYVSSTNKTDCHDITELLLKVALNTINHLEFHFEPKYDIIFIIPVWGYPSVVSYLVDVTLTLDLWLGTNDCAMHDGICDTAWLLS
jgi:hypothetical protein